MHTQKQRCLQINSSKSRWCIERWHVFSIFGKWKRFQVIFGSVQKHTFLAPRTLPLPLPWFRDFSISLIRANLEVPEGYIWVPGSRITYCMPFQCWTLNPSSMWDFELNFLWSKVQTRSLNLNLMILLASSTMCFELRQMIPFPFPKS